MKLNPDCVRDILLFVEENTGFNKYIMLSYKSCSEDMKINYDNNEIAYHIQQCKNFGFISASPALGCVTIKDLTPNGHMFLANIREEKNWSKTKEIANKTGSFSLKALYDISTNVISGLIINAIK